MDNPIIPEGAPAGKSLRGNYIGGYADVVHVYLERGWVSVLPLPSGQKSPPPTGFTGRGAQIPTPEQVEKWRRKRLDADVALALVVCDDWDYDLVGVDVDNYAKGSRPAGRAMAVIAETEGRAGVKFPATASLEHRDDGSGIWVYRVPKGLFWRSQLGPGVELIHKGHRYIAAGRHKHWKDADGQPLNEPPRPQDCAKLPGDLVLELMRDDNGTALPGLATPEAARALLDGLPDGMMNVVVRELMIRALNDLSGLNGARHDRTLSHVRDLVKYGAAGLTGTHTALGALRADFVEAVWDDPERGSREVAAAEFDRMKVNGAQLAAAKSAEELALFGVALKALAPGGRWHPDTLWPPNKTDAASEYKVFRVMGPTEWAASVPDVEMLITKAVCRDTSGPNAGPKKSLKTHDNQAIGFAVATGLNLYLSEHFPVKRCGPVLYIVGEGGQVPVQRTLHRMGRAYGLNMNDVMRDPAFPLVAAFGAAPLDSPRFRDDLKRMLDMYQPVLVLVESFYNFHPADVNAANLFERGPVIDAYHKSVQAECEGATSIMTDHYRSTGTSKSLDLDSISMAGQAENADSWITRYHRKKPNVPEGEFWLQLEFGSQQWGATEWQIDWQLGPFNHDVGHHVGEISWAVRPAAEAGGAENAGPRITFETDDEFIAYLRDYVARHPKMTQTEIQDAFEADTQRTRADIRKVWAKAREGGWITKKSLKRTEKDPRGAAREVTRQVWLPGKGQETLNEERAEWGGGR